MTRILVIDDHDQFRGMLCEMLKNAGYEVAAATDGEEGVELFRKAPADLVITDIIMPKQEGMETIIKLQEEFPDVKVIAMSGGAVPYGTAEEYLKGAKYLKSIKHTFTKPFANKDLLQAVKEII